MSPGNDDLYQLEPTPPTPRLPGVVILRPTADEAIDALAAELLLHAQNCVRQFGDFHLALSGGSTPVPLYERLMIDPALRSFPWDRTHLWIVDERRVPFEDPRSNFRMINEILGDHSGVPASHIHPIYAMAEDADTAYELRLRQVLGRREAGNERLDYVLLGVGGDGHTASLFPRSPALRWGERPPRLVRINSGPAVTPPDRVTMTLDLINTSRFIGVLVTGSSKREAITRIESVARAGVNDQAILDLPILGVKPVAGAMRWYLDHDACPVPAMRDTSAPSPGPA